jgi:hypothetical protein
MLYTEFNEQTHNFENAKTGHPQVKLVELFIKCVINGSTHLD